MPDDELLALGESNKLHLPAVLDGQVQGMLSDPKSAAFAENFAGQWLETRSLDAIRPDPKKLPEWTAELKDAMRTETRMFFESVMRENRPISDFLDGDYTFLNGCTNADLPPIDFETEYRKGILSFRIPLQTFGLGLIEAIQDQTILANSAATASLRAPPGIRSIPNRSGNDGIITRFGWKAQNKSVAMFAGEAYNVEMGITNDLFPTARNETPVCNRGIKSPTILSARTRPTSATSPLRIRCIRSRTGLPSRSS